MMPLNLSKSSVFKVNYLKMPEFSNPIKLA